MSKLKVLIVEDEPIVALDIKHTLTQLNCIVTDTVANYKDTLSTVQSNEPNLIFMDIHLHNSKNGIETVKELQKSRDIPVIYLTAFSDEDTMQQAIETNPISYILKPFKREEIKYNILLSIYKMDNLNIPLCTTTNYTPIGFDYYYDLKNNNLFYKHQPIRISENEKKFLKLLISANGKIVPFSTIEEHIWQSNTVSESTFRTLVYRLRSKLEFKLIETIPSFGYKLKL